MMRRTPGIDRALAQYGTVVPARMPDLTQREHDHADVALPGSVVGFAPIAQRAGTEVLRLGILAKCLQRHHAVGDGTELGLRLVKLEVVEIPQRGFVVLASRCNDRSIQVDHGWIGLRARLCGVICREGLTVPAEIRQTTTEQQPIWPGAWRERQPLPKNANGVFAPIEPGIRKSLDLEGSAEAKLSQLGANRQRPVVVHHLDQLARVVVKRFRSFPPALGKGRELHRSVSIL